jgi:hypothetical protein
MHGKSWNVPAAVPSVVQSSYPWEASLASKKTVPFTFVKNVAYEPPMLGVMSLTTAVPIAVPLLVHT